MNSTLELDNEHLRRKLQDLRTTNSKLIAENHQLVEMLEELGCELKSSSSRVRNLEESIDSYRSRSEELGGVLCAFKKASKSNEMDSEKLREKYKECSGHLVESTNLLTHQSDVILSLKSELEDVKNLKKKTEAERNLALVAAEKLQKTFEELQAKLRKTSTDAEMEVSKLREEQKRLCEDLESRCLRIESLERDIRTLRAEVTALKSARKDVELRNSDLRTQMKNQSTKIEKLEEDLENCKKFKVRNGEMKIVLDQQRKRVATLESEIRGSRTEPGPSDKDSSSRSKRNIPANAALPDNKVSINGRLEKRDLEKFRSADGPVIDVPSVNEAELLQLKADVLRLACSFADFSGEDFLARVLRPAQNGDRELDVQNFPEKPGFLAAAGVLGKRVLDFESVNAGLIAQLNAVVTELQEKGKEHALEKASADRELQKRTQQNLLLENQLDSKVQEIAEKVFEVNTLKIQLERSEVENAKALKELEENFAQCAQILSDVERLKQLHADQCLEMEGQMELKEKQCEKLQKRLEQSDVQCQALRQSLSQTIELADALKDDLHGCKQIEMKVLELERRTGEAEERALHLEQERTSLEAEFGVKNECFEAVVGEYKSELNMKIEQVGCLEDQLRWCEDQVRVKEAEIQRLLKQLQCEQEIARKNGEIMEKEQKVFQAKLEELKENKIKEETRRHMVELERKDSLIEELQKENSELLRERKDVEEFASKLEESERRLREVELEREQANCLTDRWQEEIKLLKVMMKDKEDAVEVLQERLVVAYRDLQGKTKTTKDSYAEVEQLKAAIHTRDSQLLEAGRRAEALENDFRECRDKVNEMRVALRCNENELRQKQVDIERLTEELQERERELEEKAERVKQLELFLTERLSIQTTSEQNLFQVKGELQKTQLSVEQYDKQVGSLEDQLHNLLGVVKEQCIKIRKGESTVSQLNSEVEMYKTRMVEQEKAVDGLRQELERSRVVCKQAEEELCASREHLRKIQHELSASKQELTGFRLEHDRLANDLSEAAGLLTLKDLELAKLVTALSEAENLLSSYRGEVLRSEDAYRRLEDCYDRDLSGLKGALEAAVAVRDEEKQGLQEDLKHAVRERQSLKKKVKLLMQQVAKMEGKGCDDQSARKVNITTSNAVVRRDCTEPYLDSRTSEDILIGSIVSEGTAHDLSCKASLRSEFSVSSDVESMESFASLKDCYDTSGIPITFTDPVGSSQLKKKARTHTRCCSLSVSSASESSSCVSEASHQSLPLVFSGFCEQGSLEGQPVPCLVRKFTPTQTFESLSSVISQPVHRSSTVSNCTTADTNRSAMGKLQTGTCQTLQHNLDLQNSINSKTMDVTSRWSKDLLQTPATRKSFSESKTLSRSETTKPTGKAKPQVVKPEPQVVKPKPQVVKPKPQVVKPKSLFSPPVASECSPDPTTAVSYYEKLFLTSNCDGEVERIFGEEDFDVSATLSHLSDD